MSGRVYGAGSGLIYGIDSNGNAAQIKAENQGLRVSLAGKKTTAGDSPLSVASQILDGNSSGDDSLAQVALQHGGLGFEFRRGNREVLLLASAVRAATTTSPVQTNHNASGVFIFVDITAVPGTDTVNPQLVIYSLLLGKTTSLNLAAAPLSGTGTLVYYVGTASPAPTPDPQLNGQRQFGLPRNWYLQMVHSAGTNFTYGVSCFYVNGG
jgi:hypothetical protein